MCVGFGQADSGGAGILNGGPYDINRKKRIASEDSLRQKGHNVAFLCRNILDMRHTPLLSETDKMFIKFPDLCKGKDMKIFYLHLNCSLMISDLKSLVKFKIESMQNRKLPFFGSPRIFLNSEYLNSLSNSDYSQIIVTIKLGKHWLSYFIEHKTERNSTPRKNFSSAKWSWIIENGFYLM